MQENILRLISLGIIPNTKTRNATFAAHIDRRDPGQNFFTHGSVTLHVEHLSPTIGTLVHNVQLKNATPSQLDAINALLLVRKVLFFPRQKNFAHADYVRVAGNFGEVENEIKYHTQHSDYPQVTEIVHDQDRYATEAVFHVDRTWSKQPPVMTMLRCCKPAPGGDTIFVDMTAAYNGLSTFVKEKLNGLYAVHSSLGLATERGDSHICEATHPVVLEHPLTGKKILYANFAFTNRIVDMNLDESSDLLRLLFTQATMPEYQVRYKWAEDDVALWDNVSCQHYAVADYFPARRVMERVTIMKSRL